VLITLPAVKLLYCDETNLDPKPNGFFLYGGLVIDADESVTLHKNIEHIRQVNNIPSDFLLKFNPGPKHLDHQGFIKVKQQVIAAAVAAGCKLLVSIILHQVATNPDDARRNEINRILLGFDGHLTQYDKYGLALIDRFEDSKIDNHLREKFSIGLRGMPISDPYRLSRILGFHYSAIGQSHFSSVIDVVIGSLRFCVNAMGVAANQATATAMLQQMSPLFERGASGKVIDRSFFFSPKTVKFTPYRKRYKELKTYLAENGIDTEQQVSS